MARISGEPLVINGSLTNADTEYELSLPLNYKKIMLQARQHVAIKFSYKPSQSGTNYITLKAGSIYSDDHIRTNAKLYIQSATAGTVVELLVWSGGDE